MFNKAMFRKAVHAAVALVVFVVLTGAFLWLSGAFSFGRNAAIAGEAAGAEKKDDCCPTEAGQAAKSVASAAKPAASAEKKPHCEGEDDGCESEGKTAKLAEIESKKCEHNIRTLDCNECRYELGVVKVAPSVTGALVKTAKAEKRELAQVLRVTGEVQFDQTRVVDVVPATAGRILSLKARLGQRVKEGDVLAILHSSELGEAKAAYLEASTSHEIAAREQVRQAELNAALGHVLEHFQKSHAGGKLDADGECMKGLTEPLGEWRSKLVGAAARLHKTRTTYEREKALLGKEASSKSEFEAARQEHQTAQAEYEALAEEVQLSLNLNKLKADNAARQAEAKMNAAEQRLHLFGLDHAAIKRIGQKKADASFAQLEIRASRSGTITAGAAAEGRYVDNTHSFFTIADLSNVWVWCDVYEKDLAALHEKLAKDHAAKAMVTVPAFPDAPFAGVVDLVGSTLDEHTRTVKVRVQLENAQGKLKPGMFATVNIELPSAGQPAVVVPRSAVLSDEGKSFAFEHWKEDLWLKRDVRVGRAQGDWVEVSGVEPGATIAIGGGFLFKSDVLRAKMGAGCAD